MEKKYDRLLTRVINQLDFVDQRIFVHNLALYGVNAPTNASDGNPRVILQELRDTIGAVEELLDYLEEKET